MGEAVGFEVDFLRPLPAERFEIAELNQVRVSDKATATVKRNHYSVPASLAGRTVATRLYPLTVELWCDQRLVALHERSYQKNVKVLQLDHYLEVLIHKPGALAGSLALHQARQTGVFPASYDRLWSRFKQGLGERAGTHALIDVLMLHRRYPRQLVHQAVEHTLAAGVCDPGAVALFARHLSEGSHRTPEPVNLDVGTLARFDRPLPETSAYDRLVGSSR